MWSGAVVEWSKYHLSTGGSKVQNSDQTNKLLSRKIWAILFILPMLTVYFGRDAVSSWSYLHDVYTNQRM